MKRTAEKRWTRVLSAVLFAAFMLLSSAADVVVRYSEYTMSAPPFSSRSTLMLAKVLFLALAGAVA